MSMEVNCELPVPRWLNELQAGLDELENCIDSLNKHLTIILTPKEERVVDRALISTLGATIPSIGENVCELAENLAGKCLKIRQFQEAIRSLENRLEI